MAILFHASPDKNLTLIEPRRTLSKNKYIGDFVFATSNRLLAIMYLTTKGTATLMNPQDGKADIVICAEQSSYIKNDLGGAIYELPAEVFVSSPQNELTDYEMVSSEPVEPLRKTIYDNSVDAMLSAGIKILFTDQNTFSSLINARSQAELIEKLPMMNPANR